MDKEEREDQGADGRTVREYDTACNISIIKRRPGFLTNLQRMNVTLQQHIPMKFPKMLGNSNEYRIITLNDKY